MGKVYAKKNNTAHSQLAALESSTRGRIGISALNTANNEQFQYHADERFPLGCTSKVIGVAAILKKSMTDKQLLQKKITYKKQDLASSWSPITERHVDDGMTIFDLCAAAITYSDNSAMNFLVTQLGGLQNINTFAHSLGDNYFRLDHMWPKEAEFGGKNNVYDSSTPATMEKSLQTLTFGNVLASPQREQLLDWMKNNTTGNARIRAGVPQGWIVGDKTETGFYYGTTNDIGIIWPPNCKPIILAVYYTNDKKSAVKREDIVASATKIVINNFAKQDQCIKNNL